MTPRHLQSHSSLNPSIEVDSFIHRYLTIRRSNWRGFHLRPFQRAFIKYICEDQKKDNLAVKRSCLLGCGAFWIEMKCNEFCHL